MRYALALDRMPIVILLCAHESWTDLLLLVHIWSNRVALSMPWISRPRIHRRSPLHYVLFVPLLLLAHRPTRALLSFFSSSQLPMDCSFPSYFYIV